MGRAFRNFMLVLLAGSGIACNPARVPSLPSSSIQPSRASLFWARKTTEGPFEGFSCLNSTATTDTLLSNPFGYLLPYFVLRHDLSQTEHATVSSGCLLSCKLVRPHVKSSLAAFNCLRGAKLVRTTIGRGTHCDPGLLSRCGVVPCSDTHTQPTQPAQIHAYTFPCCYAVHATQEIRNRMNSC